MWPRGVFSRDCQRAHWKASHKQCCVAKADRSLQHSNQSKKAASAATVTGQECSICLNPLAEASLCTFECAHVFHASCVKELRQLGVKQTCPLCRTPLPPGPEKLHEESCRRFFIVEQMVSRGRASWSALPPEAQVEYDAALAGWKAAAEQGFEMAQHNLGCLYDNGRGVPRDDDEALKWYKMAARQGHPVSQVNLGAFMREGRGVAQSDTKAVKWWQKAAAQGQGNGQVFLGNAYANGRGVAQSFAEAGGSGTERQLSKGM